jgi:hypothetical protein
MPLIKAVGSSLLAVGSFGLATAISYSLSGLVDCWIAGEFIAGVQGSPNTIFIPMLRVLRRHLRTHRVGR